jgi:hypothetical protein
MRKIKERSMANGLATASIAAIFYTFKNSDDYKIWLQWFGRSFC